MPAINTTFNTEQKIQWYRSQLKMHQANLRAAIDHGYELAEQFHQGKCEYYESKVKQLEPIRPPLR